MPANPGNVAGANERNRIATYVTLLELADSLKREPQDPDFFQLVARPDPQVSLAVQSILDDWACYAVRDMLAVTHEAAMNAVMDELAARHGESAYVDATTLIAEMLARTDDINSPLQELGLLATNESYENLTFQELERRVENAARPTPGCSCVQRWCGDLTEPSVRRLVAPGTVAVFGLLPVAWLLARRRVDTTQAKGIEMLQSLSSQGWSRIGMQQTMLPLLQQWHRENRTLPAVIFQLVRRTVEQHLRIAWSRLVTDPTKDVALLIADGEQWFFRKKFRHGRPASRLRETVGWLRQLGLVDQQGITTSGRDVLCRGHKILVDKAPGSSL
jgi:hypothetical protein